MYDHQLYLRTLSEFTRELLSPYEVHTVLGQLADRVTDILGLAGSGVSLARDDRLEFDTAYGPKIAEVERTQERVQQGPCVTAFQTGQVVAVSDLSAHHDQWPDYCAAADHAGVTAVASLPLGLGGQTVGALNLYADGPREWSEEDLAAARVMADMATAYLINASTHEKQLQLTRQLQHALDSRVIIEQAKGMLAARHESSPDDVFERIRRHARSHNSTVTSVCEAIVQGTLDL